VEYTSIRLSRRTLQKLRSLKRTGESDEDVIRRLLEGAVE
jgi:predicted CopG family antitoxin